MISIREQDRPAQRSQASKAPTGAPSSNKSADGNYKDPLGSNKPGPSDAPAEAPVGPP